MLFREVPSGKVRVYDPEVGGRRRVRRWVSVYFRELLAWKVRSGKIGDMIYAGGAPLQRCSHASILAMPDFALDPVRVIARS